MKKKPLIILVLVVIVIAAGLGIFLLARNSGGPAVGGEDVRLYYYRNIPGLRRAEEDDAVVSVHKDFALDEKGLTIEIDRLWIGAERAWALYHIGDGTSLTPSGTLVLTGTGGETALYTASGEETEQILAEDGLYGYFAMHRMDPDTDIGTVEQASLYPVGTRNRWLSTQNARSSRFVQSYRANP